MPHDSDRDPRKEAPQLLPEVGDVNVLEVAIGLRGFGKSTKLSERAMDLASDCHGAYVIGHSLGARLPDRLPDGRDLPIRYYLSIAALDAGLRRWPGDWHVMVGGPADPVIQYARNLSIQVRSRAWYDTGKIERWDITRKMKGIRAVPIIVLIDEMIALDAAGGNTQGKAEHAWFREFIFSLRHEHIAMFAGIQNAAARSWLMVEQATMIHAVHARHAWALELLRAAGATPEQLDQIRTADVGEIVTIGAIPGKKPA